MSTKFTTAWQVPVADLLRHPGSKREVSVAGPLGDVAVTGSRVQDGANAAFEGTVESLDGGAIQVRGRVRTTWIGECRRCLGVAAGDLDVEVRELYERDAESEDIYPLGSKGAADRLDLEPLVRDAIYLELPQAPLCQADCQGLCPECGADRNTVDCGHAVDELDPRWAALRELGEQN